MPDDPEVAYRKAEEKIEAARRAGAKALDLSSMGLTSVPEALGELVVLQELYLYHNQLTTLPAEICKLTELTKLWLYNNQLMTLPAEIGDFTSLTELSLGSNRLQTLSTEIGKLTSLRELYLSYNQITRLPTEVGKLAALTEFEFISNQITTLPTEFGQLTSLRSLNLSINQLTSLPEALRTLCTEGKLEHLFLHGNPALGLPAEVLGPRWNEVNDENPAAKPAGILDYYFSIRGSAGQALREVKLILVGRGEVGKSTMADVLRGKEFVKDRARTDGVAISPWDVKLPDGEAKVLLWDFGGQEIMHGTHQFFLTHRSLYVVMVDGRDDRAKQNAEYWLKLVRAFGGESPVLVVMNRQKAHPFDVDRQYLADKYGVKLEHFFRTDCETKKDIAPLREAILEEVARMLATEERFPKNRWEVKARLERMKEEKEDYLSEERYAEICDEHGVKDPEEQGKLLRRLADLGTVVSFPDDGNLSEFSVLNPEWATDGIYRVVTNEPLREEKHGQLRCASLRDLLPRDRWPKPKHLQYIVELMKKFELCFPVGEGEDSLLVPELLPDKTPPLPDWDAAQCVVFHYQYTVLPHGVLPRFITRTHTLSHGRARWRTGVVLADDGAEALVKADYDANLVSVWVRGPHADARRALLKVVRHHFEHIHARIKELKPKELVALKGHPDVLESFIALVMDERRGKTTVAVTVGEERTDKPIGDFLDCIEPALERRKAAKTKKAGRTIHLEPGAQYHEHHEPMNQDSHDIPSTAT
jgi:internalin A